MQKPTVKATVVLLFDNEGRVCLARKKQPIHHDGGEITYSLGMYNGYGGKMEATDATILHTAVRECFDESGVTVSDKDLSLRARVHFFIQKENLFEAFMEVSFFFAHTWNGDPQEGSEMGSPQFFSQGEIPYHEMMPADKILFERMLSGERNIYEVKLFGKDAPPSVDIVGDIA